MIYDETGEVEQAYIKCLIYGRPGTGKTYTALKIATGLGKTLMIDTERGSEPYRKRFKDPYGNPFIIGRTRNAKMIIKEVLPDAIKMKVECLIIDQISTIWDDCQTVYMMKEYNKRSKAWSFIEKNGKIPFQGWGFIKGIYKKMVRALLDVPMHVFILARAGTKYKVTSAGEPIEIGIKAACEKETPYDPAILIRMEHDEGSDIWTASCEKDRWSCLEGKTFDNPGMSMFDPILVQLGGTQGTQPQPETDMIEDEGEYKPVKNTMENAQKALLNSLCKKNNLDEALFENHIKDMNTEEASVLIKDMTIGNIPELD